MARRLFTIAGAAAVSAVAVAGAAAHPGQSVSGTAHFEVGGGADVSVQVGARSGPAGEDPTGHITLRTIAPATGEYQTFHGDVREGCLIVTGNRAIVVGRLPEEEEFDVPGAPPPFRIEFVAVIVQDNGPPIAGQPTDLATPIFLRATSAATVCALGTAIPTVPFQHGNFVVEDA